MMTRKIDLKRMWAPFTCVFLSVFVFAAQVMAQGNIHIGRMKVSPEIKYSAMQDDNIFLSKENEEDDLIHKISPGIVFSYTRDHDNFFFAGYNLDVVIYSDFDENNYEKHVPFVSFGMKTPAGFYLKAEDRFVKTADPYGTETQYNIGVQTERWHNTGNVTVGFEFARRFAIEGTYQNYMERFDETVDEWQNRFDHVGAFSFLFNVSPITSVLAQVQYTKAEYDEQSDGINYANGIQWNDSNSQNYELYDYYLGLRFRPGGKLSGEVKFGYGEKKFESEIDPFGRKYEDRESWIAQTKIDYWPTKRTLISGVLSRGHKGAPDIHSTSYLDTLIRLTFRHAVSERFSFFVVGEWNNNDYSNEYPTMPKKYYNIYGGRAGLDIAIMKWFSLGVEYTHTRKEASNDYYDYDEYENNIMLGYVKASF